MVLRVGVPQAKILGPEINPLRVLPPCHSCMAIFTPLVIFGEEVRVEVSLVHILTPEMFRGFYPLCPIP